MGQVNTMRWDCERQGCFNVKHRCKLGMLAEALPGRIAFTDVDGMVEINGYCLILEWKGVGVPIPTGQHIMFTRITVDRKITVFVIEGDAEFMKVESIGQFVEGKKYPQVPASLECLIEKIKKWVAWAQSNKKGKV